MADNAVIVLNDGTNNHTMSPNGIDGPLARYQNLAETMLAGRETLVMGFKYGKAVRETSATLRLPCVVSTTVDGVVRKQVENFGQGQVKLLIPPTWTAAQTAVLRVLTAQAALSAAYAALADQDEFVW